MVDFLRSIYPSLLRRSVEIGNVIIWEDSLENLDRSIVPKGAKVENRTFDKEELRMFEVQQLSHNNQFIILVLIEKLKELLDRGPYHLCHLRKSVLLPRNWMTNHLRVRDYRFLFVFFYCCYFIHYFYVVDNQVSPIPFGFSPVPFNTLSTPSPVPLPFSNNTPLLSATNILAPSPLNVRLGMTPSPISMSPSLSMMGTSSGFSPVQMSATTPIYLPKPSAVKEFSTPIKQERPTKRQRGNEDSSNNLTLAPILT
eukprot:TRINITY_DN79_c0_g1_i3.p1 TRINITY_DN79_c0_g1~~TRINITY_DN79_c0_g1_i3.p1  ORF type:complete len:255 (+),score=35.12 TRINITY_DN79_c0_g1_i3:303-1067(+)